MGRKLKAQAIALTLLFVIATPGYAQRSFTALGAGNSTCSEFLADYDKEQMRRVYLGWIAGFLLGAQYGSDRSIDETKLGVDWGKTTLGWIKTHCEKNPLDKIAAAASHFYVTIRRPR